MKARFAPLVAAVRTNCHISDARHARSMTLCTYLLEMRELYRWEQGIAQTASLPRERVAAWLTTREALWARFEDAPYRRIPLAGRTVDPFDAETINATLVHEGLVYGAGVGRFGKPEFFVGALEREERREGVRILVAGCEHARDVAPAPAASRSGTIYVRRESLRRVLWEKTEAWAVKRPGGALLAALEACGYAAGAATALERMVDEETETLILHELGECRVARLLGREWERMLASLSDRHAELLARAVRDLLADCLVTLPALLDSEAAGSLHLWFASIDGLRRQLAPRLADAYAAWCAGDGGDALRAAVSDGAVHWQRVCEQLLSRHAAGGGKAVIAMAGDPETRFVSGS